MCLLLFLYLFSWMWSFCTVLFTFYPTTSKSILFLPLLHTKTNILSLFCCVYISFIFHMYTFMRLYSSFTKAFFHYPHLSEKSSLELLLFYPSFSVYSYKCYPHAKKTIYYFMCCKQQLFLLFHCVFTVNNPMLNAFPRRPLTQTQSFLSNNSFSLSLARFHSNNWLYAFQLLHICKKIYKYFTARITSLDFLFHIILKIKALAAVHKSWLIYFLFAFLFV